MRTLSKKSRMQADSLAEIRRGLEQMAFDLKGHRVGNRPVSEGHVINAAVLVLMGMAEEERARSIVDAFGKMNALLACEDGDSERIREIIVGGIAGPADGPSGGQAAQDWGGPKPRKKGMTG